MKFNDYITRRAAEIGRAFRNFKYEATDDGRVLVANKTMIGGVFAHAHAPAIGGYQFGGLDHDPNRLVTQGLIDILNTYFGPTAKKAAFYLVPFEGNATPDADWDAADFNAQANEFTDYIGGANRLTWTPTAATTTAVIGNSASLAQIQMNPTGGPFNIYGCGLITSQAKLAATGVLVAATRFAAPRLGLAINDKLALEYVFTGYDVADAP